MEPLVGAVVLAEAAPNNAALFLGDMLVATGSFVILLLLIKKFAWKNITKIFEERAKKIATDIDEAERAREKAKQLATLRQTELDNSKQEAQNILQNAKDSGSISRQNIITEAQEEVSRKKQQAQTDIEQSKQEALLSVKGDVAEISLQIAQKILNKELSSQAHQELIDDFVSKLGNSYETR